MSDFTTELLRLRSDLAAIRVMVSLLKLHIHATKANFNPAQLRIPAGNARESGRWADGRDSGEIDALLHLANGRRGGIARTPREQYLSALVNEARIAKRRVLQLDPAWRAPEGAYQRGSLEGMIRDREAVRDAANARFDYLTRDVVPRTDPIWGVNRLTKELYAQGFRLDRPTRGDGVLLRHPNGDEVRIMERPSHRWPNEPPQKHYFGFYYRYRARNWPEEGRHVPIPD